MKITKRQLRKIIKEALGKSALKDAAAEAVHQKCPGRGKFMKELFERLSRNEPVSQRSLLRAAGITGKDLNELAAKSFNAGRSVGEYLWKDLRQAIGIRAEVDSYPDDDGYVEVSVIATAQYRGRPTEVGSGSFPTHYPESLEIEWDEDAIDDVMAEAEGNL